jgi:hypothetical protein
MGSDTRDHHLTPTTGAATDLDQEIRLRAYELFRKRSENGDAGDELSDWMAAEALVRERHAADLD